MSESPSLRVDLGGLEMKNPLTVASGTFASGREFSDFFDVSLLGAVTTKGVSYDPWTGNDSPRIAETCSGLLNSIGLQNPGVEEFCTGDLAWLSTQDVPIIVNVSGHSVPEYVKVIERLEEERHVSAYEVNISCPNVDEGGMTFGTDPDMAAKVVSACRDATSRPLIVKLSPNVTDICEIARAAEASGADALSLINTLLGMAIDPETRRARLARKVGGLSGPAIKPIAVRMVYQVHLAVDVPLLGMGGIMAAEDAIEFFLAGATAIAVGTASFHDPLSAPAILEGIRTYCERHGIDDIHELIGALDS